MLAAPFTIAVLLAVGSSACSSSGLRFEAESAQPARVRVDGQTLHVDVGGEPFTSIHLNRSQTPYLYPVLGPGGVPLTRGYPMDPQPGEASDHPHHRSLWLTHGNVNGFDFWHEGGRPGRIRWTGDARVEDVDGAVLVTLELEWVAADEVLLTERRRMRFSASAHERRIDVTSELTAALNEVVFGDTKEGSMAIRVRPELRLEGDGERAAGTLLNSNGTSGGKVWGQRAAWVDYAAPIGGRTLGIAMFDHPKNPRHPTWWHARSYGLFAANPFGVSDFEKKPKGTGDLKLARGERLVLRYRILLHDGARTAEQLEAELAAFGEG